MIYRKFCKNIFKNQQQYFSQDWYNNHINDPYTKKAQKMNYRSRAAFKLIEIIEKYKIFKQRNYRVLELGAAPGSWTQVLQKTLLKNSHIVALDQDPIKPIFVHKHQPQISYIEGDIYDSKIISQIKLLTKGKLFDVILSDMAPNISGVNDEFKIYSLNYRCIEVAQQLLKKKGTLIVKGFMNSKDMEFSDYLHLHFATVNRFKPLSSRKKSTEIFYVNEGFQKTLFWNIINSKGQKLSLQELINDYEQQKGIKVNEDFKESLVGIIKQRIIDEKLTKDQLKYQFEKDLYDLAQNYQLKKPMEQMTVQEAKKEAQNLIKKYPDNESLQILSDLPIEEHEIEQKIKELNDTSLFKLQKMAANQKVTSNEQLLDLESELQKAQKQSFENLEKDDPFEQALKQHYPIDMDELDKYIEILDEQQEKGVDISRLKLDDVDKIRNKQKQETKMKFEYYKDQEIQQEKEQENLQEFKEYQQALNEFEGDPFHQQKLIEVLDQKIQLREYGEQKKSTIEQINEQKQKEEEQDDKQRDKNIMRQFEQLQDKIEKENIQKKINKAPRQQKYEESKGKKKFDQLIQINQNYNIVSEMIFSNYSKCLGLQYYNLENDKNPGKLNLLPGQVSIELLSLIYLLNSISSSPPNSTNISCPQLLYKIFKSSNLVNDSINKFQ